VKFLWSVLVGIVILGSSCFAYTDISSSHWAYSDLMALSERQIVSGYPDGSFQPSREISKAEFLSLLQKSLFPNADVSSVSGKWYEGVYQYFLKVNLLNPYAFQSGKLENAITRFEVAEAFVYCFPKAKLAYLEEEYTGKSQFNDTFGEQERKLAAIMMETGVLEGYPDGTIRWDASVTRAEMVCMISNLLEKREGLANFTFYNNEFIYEDNYVITTDLQTCSELQPFQYMEDERLVITKLDHIELIDSLENLPEKYQEIFQKLGEDAPYYRLKKSKIKGNKLIVVEFETINRSEQYSTLTGADFLHLQFLGRDDIKIIDRFDTNAFSYVDQQIPIENFEIMPQSTHKTTAVYIVNDLPDKIRFHRNVTTMYFEDEYIHMNSTQALTVYL